MKRTLLMLVGASAAAAALLWPHAVRTHETLTTTVLFDREIVRILDKHCAMCHMEAGPAVPLETYEQTWLKRREIRAGVIARHMPPWAAVPGYGAFLNDNSLTLRETQFVVSWVEGLGPRNGGTVFRNISEPGAPRPEPVRAHGNAHAGHWQLGVPDLLLHFPAQTIEPRAASGVRRTVVETDLTSERHIRRVEYMPGDRRVVRAAFFSVQETGQWIGSWTPWHGFVELPSGVAFKLPAGSHVVAEVHYRGGVGEPVVDHGMLGLSFAEDPSPRTASDLVLQARETGSAAGFSRRLRAEAVLPADTHALALRPELSGDIASLEVSARAPDGGTAILLFARDFPEEWPTPYILKEPVLLRRGTRLFVTAYSDAEDREQAAVRVTVSRY